MDPIPESAAVAVLGGRTLEMICCTENTTAFHFGKGLFVNSFGTYGWCESGGSGPKPMEHPLASSGPLALIGRKVARVAIVDDRRVLQLEFEGGARLEFRSHEAYESFDIVIHDERFIV